MRHYPLQWDTVRLVHTDIESELQKAGITLLHSHMGICSKMLVITTNEPVPEDTVAKICRYAAYKGIVARFEHDRHEDCLSTWQEQRARASRLFFAPTGSSLGRIPCEEPVR